MGLDIRDREAKENSRHLGWLVDGGGPRKRMWQILGA